MSISFTTEITCDTPYLGKWLRVVQLFGAGAEIQMLAVWFCVLYNIYMPYAIRKSSYSLNTLTPSSVQQGFKRYCE